MLQQIEILIAGGMRGRFRGWTPNRALDTILVGTCPGSWPKVALFSDALALTPLGSALGGGSAGRVQSCGRSLEDHQTLPMSEHLRSQPSQRLVHALPSSHDGAFVCLTSQALGDQGCLGRAGLSFSFAF